MLAQTVIQGGWPAITPGWTQGTLDVVKTVADTRRTLLDSPLVGIFVDIDIKNTSRSRLYVRLSSPYTYSLSENVVVIMYGFSFMSVARPARIFLATLNPPEPQSIRSPN